MNTLRFINAFRTCLLLTYHFDIKISLWLAVSETCLIFLPVVTIPVLSANGTNLNLANDKGKSFM